MSQPRITVLIVDDHAMVRKGLALFIDSFPDLCLLGEAGDGEEAQRRCEELHPDIVLMDMVLPGMSGADATRAIRKRHGATQVIALTSFPEEGLVERALQAGAIGYLLKDVSADALAAAIRAAHMGRATLAPEATGALLQRMSRPTPPGQDLTRREREVIGLLVRGLTNYELAVALAVSPATAKAHVSNVISKLGVSNRTEVVALALQHNLAD